MLKIFLLFLLAICFVVNGFGQSAKLKDKDFDVLLNAQWTGNLFYLDYSSGKKVSIPSNLMVMKLVGEKSAWTFDYQYPDEPKANNKETIKLTDGGNRFDNEKVVEKTKLPNKRLKIITEANGMDNEKKAIIRHTYLLSKTAFSIKKEIRYENESDFFVRHEYVWTKQN